MATPLFPQDAFHIPSGVTHVCAAGESAPLKAHQDALIGYLADKSNGRQGRKNQEEELDRVRELVAKDWNVQFRDIGFISCVAEGICMILESLKWRETDNICVDADEYPSLVAPFAFRAQHSRSSVDDKSVTPDEGHSFSPRVCFTRAGTIESDIDAATRLIAVSYVSYLNGSRVDLAYYRRLADSVGAILVVDFTQAAGYTAIDASIADFSFSACYKWLLGTTGTAIACWNHARQPNWQPSTAGWHSIASGTARPSWETETIRLRDDALCFSRGNPAHLSIYLLNQGLNFLHQWDTVKVEEHVQTLTVQLLDALKLEGIQSSTPEDKNKHGASVTIDCTGASKIVEEMDKVGVYAWNGRGRVRFSFHGYNSTEDVKRILEVFPPLWRTFS